MRKFALLAGRTDRRKWSKVAIFKWSRNARNKSNKQKNSKRAQAKTCTYNLNFHFNHTEVICMCNGKCWLALCFTLQFTSIVKHRFNTWRRYRGRQPTGPEGGCATLVLVMVRCSMSCNGQLWRPRGVCPLCFSSTRFIVGTMSIDKDKYLPPPPPPDWPRLREQDLPGPHNSQYCRPKTYSDALKYSYFPMTIPHWNSLAPTVAADETTEEFRTLI